MRDNDCGRLCLGAAASLGLLGGLLGSKLKRFFGRLLFSRPATRPRAGDANLKLGDNAFDFKFLIVRGTVGCHHVVRGQGNLAALQILLQQCLRILPEGLRIHRLHDRMVELGNRRARRQKAAVEKHGAKQGFERIGQNRRTAKAPALELALA